MASPGFAPLTPASLTSAIMAFFAGFDEGTLASIQATVEREVERAGPGSVARLSERVAEDETGWVYAPPDPLARRIHRALADLLLAPGSHVAGVHHAALVADGPVVILGNHLSYSDANLLDVLLDRSGQTALADRLTAMAGPKVFTSRRRRFSSLCFGTIKTPQSADVSSEDAVMTAREVARAARQVIDLAHARLRAGDALIVYAEGTRSRTKQMQRHLPGAARYLEGPADWMLPVGMIGTEEMFPVGEEQLRPVRVVATLGQPVRTSQLREITSGDRRLMADVAGLAVAASLPASYRGTYGEHAPGLEEARRLFARLRRGTA